MKNQGAVNKWTIVVFGIFVLFACISAIGCHAQNVEAEDMDSDEVWTDPETGLIWQRCSLGQSGEDCAGGDTSTFNWRGAMEAAVPPWRLPNINELRSIVEEKCFDPAINLSVFPNTHPSMYWSASPTAIDSTRAWTLRFHYGYASYGAKSYYKYVRLVRDAQ